MRLTNTENSFIHVSFINSRLPVKHSAFNAFKSDEKKEKILRSNWPTDKKKSLFSFSKKEIVEKGK
jgi:hypothetical protein